MGATPTSLNLQMQFVSENHDMKSKNQNVYSRAWQFQVLSKGTAVKQRLIWVSKSKFKTVNSSNL
jgi:hypothetical protein